MKTWTIERERAERRDLQIDLARVLLARVNGEELPARLSFYTGLSLADILLLAMPRGAHHLAGVSSDFPIISGDVFQTKLVDFYSALSPTFRQLTRPISLSSYRKSNLARPGEFVLKQRGEGGEVETGMIADGGEQIALVRYSKIFALSGIQIANDEIGAFSDMPRYGAQAAAGAGDDLFFKLLTANSGVGPTLSDGVAFFDATRGNTLTGSALASDKLGLAIAALGKMTAPGGTLLNLRPAVLLCGPDSASAAHTAVAALTAGGAPPLLDVIVDGHLTTQWYVLASPADRPAFVCGYLFGRETPSVMSEAAWEVDGVKFLVTIDIGVAPFDPRACVRNPGT